MSFRHLLPVVQAIALAGFLAVCPSAKADNPATDAYRAAAQPSRLPPMPSEGEADLADETPVAGEPAPSTAVESEIPAVVERLPPIAERTPVASEPAPSTPAENEPPVAGDRAPTTVRVSEEPLQPETVRERYPDGKIRIERQVKLDAKNDYVNHGPYAMYDRHGNQIVTGQYHLGKQHGTWVRHFVSGQGQLFSGELDKSFQGPFISEATFVDGKLHGTWTIASAGTKFKVIEWCFEKGVRHGKATWWYPNGEKRREVDYRDGLPDGDVLEWAPDKRLVRKETFIDSRQLAKRVEWHARDRKKYEGTYLLARQPVQTFDWAGNTASTVPAEEAGVDQKHGLWIAWYANGQKMLEGNYRKDVPVGKFTWWYETGQKQAEGQYLAGVQEGTWITWHPNGMKQSKAVYKAGDLAGEFMRWEPSGRLKDLGDFSPNNVRKPSDRARTGENLLRNAQAPRPVPAK